MNLESGFLKITGISCQRQRAGRMSSLKKWSKYVIAEKGTAPANHITTVNKEIYLGPGIPTVRQNELVVRVRAYQPL
jgi:hypothetical protein